MDKRRGKEKRNFLRRSIFAVLQIGLAHAQSEINNRTLSMAMFLSSRRVNIILDREKRRLYKFLGKSRAHHEYWSGG